MQKAEIGKQFKAGIRYRCYRLILERKRRVMIKTQIDDATSMTIYHIHHLGGTLKPRLGARWRVF
jgi:hypothetical protein